MRAVWLRHADQAAPPSEQFQAAAYWPVDGSGFAGGPHVEYRGIAYDVKMDAGKGRWVWTVHPPVRKTGRSRGTRAGAIEAAIKAIRVWCYTHPASCRLEEL